MRIQHNIMAMNSYRNLSNNNGRLSKNLEKLSSGYKINRAGDDAAGLAISEKMRAQITGLDAASKNVKDGISLVKTAEGALQEIQDMLNRMVYLSEQSANGTYDNEVDRAALQDEVNALNEEINRIATVANFNGMKLLDGSVNPGSSYSIIPTVPTVDATKAEVDMTFDNLPAGIKVAFAHGTTAGAVVSGDTLTLTLDSSKDYTSADIQTLIGNATEGTPAISLTGVDLDDIKAITADGSIKKATGTGDGFYVSKKADVDLSFDFTEKDIKVEITNGTTEKAEAANDTVTITLNPNKSYTAADISSILKGATGSLSSLTDVGIDVVQNAVVTGSVRKATDVNNGDGFNIDTTKSKSTNREGDYLTLQIGDTTDDLLKFRIIDMRPASLGVDGLDISKSNVAIESIDKIKTAINTVSSQRGELGAIQNRLEHTHNNLSVMRENIQDAESTIRDTDVAEEMMAYTKNNILVQSAQSMLAQANQVPQGVLQLMQ